MTDLFSQAAPDHIDAHGFRYYREDVHPGPKKADDSGFDRFWKNVPTGFKIGREEARKEFSKLKADEKHTAINSVGPFFAHWQKSHPDAGRLHPCRFLKNKRWTDEGWEAKAAPTAIDKDAFDAATIKRAMPFLCKDMSANRGRYLIDKGLVTETECKKAGVL